MLKGKVCWFNAQKGFGFLNQDNGEPDIFVHFSAIKMNGYKELKQNQRVEYEIEIGPRRDPQACNVQVVE